MKREQMTAYQTSKIKTEIRAAYLCYLINYIYEPYKMYCIGEPPLPSLVLDKVNHTNLPSTPAPSLPP